MSKARMTVTIDADILRAIDEERGELIPRSRYTNHLLKKGLLAIKKEREAIENSEEGKSDI